MIKCLIWVNVGCWSSKSLSLEFPDDPFIASLSPACNGQHRLRLYGSSCVYCISASLAANTSQYHLLALKRLFTFLHNGVRWWEFLRALWRLSVVSGTPSLEERLEHQQWAKFEWSRLSAAWRERCCNDESNAGISLCTIWRCGNTACLMVPEQRWSTVHPDVTARQRDKVEALLSVCI